MNVWETWRCISTRDRLKCLFPTSYLGEYWISQVARCGWGYLTVVLMPVAIQYNSCTRRCSRIKAPLTFERSLLKHVLILWSSELHCSWSSVFQRLNSDTFRPFSSLVAPSSKNHLRAHVLDIKLSLPRSPPDKGQQDSDGDQGSRTLSTLVDIQGGSSLPADQAELRGACSPLGSTHWSH